MTSRQKGKAKTTQPVISFLFFFLCFCSLVFRATLIQRSDVSPCTEEVLSDPPPANSNSASPVITAWLGRNEPAPCATGSPPDGGLERLKKQDGRPEQWREDHEGRPFPEGPVGEQAQPRQPWRQGLQVPSPCCCFTVTWFLWDARRKHGEVNRSPAGARRE